MLLKRSIFFIISVSAVLAGCAPKSAPPPLYKDARLTLQEIIDINKSDITAIKAITTIQVHENNRPRSLLDASFFLKTPNSIDLRLYKFGMLVGDLSVRNNTIRSASGKSVGSLKHFGPELYHAIFWWEDIADGTLQKSGREYLIRSATREVRLDAFTLLPISQRFSVKKRPFDVMYENPIKTDSTNDRNGKKNSYWYPSSIRITTGNFRFDVEVSRFIVNPS